jgi:hypothetical protein
MKGKSPCRSLVCSVFAGCHGHAQRRSWTSSWVCLVSIGSRAPRACRGRRPLINTPCITLGRPRVHIQTKVPLRHILEMPLLGRVGIDLNLGQKPKLGGGIPTSHSFIHHILSELCISILYFLSFSLLFLFLFLLSKTQKDQKYFCCFSLFASLVF